MRELDDGRRSTQGTFLCESRGKNNPEQGTGSICPGEVQLPAVLLNHLPGYRQTKSGTTILAIGHKGLKKGVTNRLPDAGTVVPNANLNSAVPPDGSELDSPGVRRYRLASMSKITRTSSQPGYATVERGGSGTERRARRAFESSPCQEQYSSFSADAILGTQLELLCGRGSFISTNTSCTAGPE